MGLGAWSVARAADRPVLPVLVAEQADLDFVRPLLKLVAEGGGFDWQFVIVPWARLLVLAMQGDALAWGLSRSPERDAVLNFSEQVFNTRVWLVTPAGQPLSAPTVAGLDGRKLCKRRGFTLGAALDLAEREQRFQVIDSDLGYDGLLRMLAAGRCDGLLMTYRSGDPAVVEQRIAMMAPPAGRFVVQRPPLSEGGIYFAAARKRPELQAQLQRVNAGLRAQAQAIQAVVASNA